jgi:hypothetical protein
VDSLAEEVAGGAGRLHLSSRTHPAAFVSGGAVPMLIGRAGERASGRLGREANMSSITLETDVASAIAAMMPAQLSQVACQKKLRLRYAYQ